MPTGEVYWNVKGSHVGRPHSDCDLKSRNWIELRLKFLPMPLLPTHSDPNHSPSSKITILQKVLLENNKPPTCLALRYQGSNLSRITFVCHFLALVSAFWCGFCFVFFRGDFCLIKKRRWWTWQGEHERETFRGSQTLLHQCTHYFWGELSARGTVRKREEQRRKAGNDVQPGEKMQDTNRHLEAGVCNNHTSQGWLWGELLFRSGPTAFYKGKAIFDQNHKITCPFYRNTYFFPMYFPLSPCMAQEWWEYFVLAEYIHITHT